MPPKHDVSASDLHTELVTIIHRFRDEGYLFNGEADEIAKVAIRRWHSFERRRPKLKSPSADVRLRDLVKGLQARFEPTGMYVRVEEWEGISDAMTKAIEKSLA